MQPDLIFYLFAGLTALPVVGILLTRNLLYAAFLLVLVFLGVAGLFVLASAEFVAVSQILIYVGGILILLVFGIMLTNRIAGQQVLTDVNRTFVGLLLSTAIFVVLAVVFSGFEGPGQSTSAINPGSVERLGMALLTDYILIFEVIGFLLLVALVGAATIARHKQESA